jgi:hypothetical protein
MLAHHVLRTFLSSYTQRILLFGRVLLSNVHQGVAVRDKIRCLTEQSSTMLRQQPAEFAGILVHISGLVLWMVTSD